ncbi:MAG: ferrous iron transport protein B [Opitutales bacterium]|nr:ferrous iron transport protein B [Opitutales bacterium]
MNARRIFLVGNPNVGKTTLFNDLTGAQEKVANYVGVTHATQQGIFSDPLGHRATVYDLPGTYSISAYTPEEHEIFDLLYHADHQARVVYVLDARSLERNLFLGTQLLELGLPICFVICFAHCLQKQGHWLDVKALEEKLQVPIVCLSARSSIRRRQIREVVAQDRFQVRKDFHLSFPHEIELLWDQLAQKTGLSSGWCGLLLLQDPAQRGRLTGLKETDFAQTVAVLDQQFPQWKTKAITVRYEWIEKCVQVSIHHSLHTSFSWNWDWLLLHRIWGPIVTGSLFFIALLSIFAISEYPMVAGERGIEALQTWLKGCLPDTWWRALLLEGVIGGVGNVLLFLPQFVLTVGFLSVLENTGYVVRMVYLLDGWMKKIGLSGASFLSLISCYACTIPGIMQARCLWNREERLTTLFVAPWVNCASRIPIYLLLISLLFQNITPCQKTLLIFAIYLTGLMAALLLAAFIRKFFLKTRMTVSISEIPPLIWPQWTYVLKVMKAQMLFFLKKAGTWVFAFSVFLWLCLHLNISASNGEKIDCVHWMGGKLEKILKPIGFDGNLGVSLLSSFGTRENFISTLGVLYNVDTKQPGCLREQLQQAVDRKGKPVYSFATCISLILFFMFSLQCMGTFISMRFETHSWRLTLLQFFFMNGFSYGLCFIVYHLLS